MSLPDWTLQPLAYIGLASLFYTTLQLTRQASIYLLPTSTLQKRYNPNKTSWALVTGASDGIGFGFSEELCARGFNVILHGRNVTKLRQRQASLAVQYPDAKTGILVQDVTELSSGEMDELAKRVQSIIAEKDPQGQLRVLINNVGGETLAYEPLTRFSFEDVHNTIARNAVFMAQITRVLLPLLQNHAPGLVLNVSSVASFGLPYISVYSGTKGFVDSMTRALEAEIKAEGKEIEVLGLRVASVQSAGFDFEASLFTPSARRMAAAGLNRVGCGGVIVYGYFWHWVQGLSFDLLPRGLLMKFSAIEMRRLKKAEEEKGKKRR